MKASRATQELNLNGAVSRLGKKIQIRACVFTFSLLPEKWSFHVANFWRMGKKCTEIIKAREGRAKVLLVFIKYAKFVALSLPSRRRSETPYFLDENAERGYGKI